MIHLFKKYPYKGIKNELTGEYTNEEAIANVMKEGHEVIYTCAKTGNNLLNRIFYIEKDGFGPDEPLMKAKKRSCSRCGKETVNWFRCHDCWDYHRIRQTTKDLSEEL